MAPNTNELYQQTSVKEAVAQQSAEFEDCLPCRLMGSAAFTGLGIYSYASGMSQLKKQQKTILQSGSRIGMGPRRFGIFTISAVLVGMGVYRLQN